MFQILWWLRWMLVWDMHPNWKIIQPCKMALWRLFSVSKEKMLPPPMQIVWRFNMSWVPLWLYETWLFLFPLSTSMSRVHSLLSMSCDKLWFMLAAGWIQISECAPPKSNFDAYNGFQIFNSIKYNSTKICPTPYFSSSHSPKASPVSNITSIYAMVIR